MRLAGVVASRAAAGGGLPLDALTTGLIMPTSPHRRLLTSYTGPLIQVRRSQDNAVQDIGYTGANKLDETALNTFVLAGGGGGGDAHVTRIYFQDGSGNYLRPTHAMTVIYSFGTFNRSGNIPCEKAGTGNAFTYVSAAMSLTGATMSCYAGRSYGNLSQTDDVTIGLATSDGWALFGTAAVMPLTRQTTTSNINGFRNNTGVTTPINVSSYFVAGCRLTGANMVVHAAGTTQSAASTGTLAVVNVLRGTYNVAGGQGCSSDNSLLGELVLWSSDIGSTALEAAMANYTAFMAS